MPDLPEFQPVELDEIREQSKPPEVPYVSPEAGETRPAPELPDAYRGYAIASLVLGCCALCLSILVIGLLPALAGLILGIFYLRRSRGPRGMAVWGTLSSGCAMVVGLCALVAVIYGVMLFKDMAQDMPAGMEQDYQEWKGVPAPDFEVTTLDGKTLRLSELKGKRVVLDCFAVWCPPCHMLSKNLDRLAAEKSDIVVLSLAKDDAAKLRDGWPGKESHYSVASVADLPAPYGTVTSYPTVFFIDSKGIFQDAAVGYMEYGDLVAKAAAPDYAGPVLGPPKAVSEVMEDAAMLMKPVPVWERPFTGGCAVCTGDWNGDGADDIIATAADRFTCFDASGTILAETKFQAIASAVRFGCYHGEPRLALLQKWDRVTVVDRSGKKLWGYKSWSGCDDARWIDVDGTGNDSLLVGMNGFSGLHLVSPEGKKRWANSSKGNCWTQAAVRTSRGEALLYTTSAMGSISRFSTDGKSLGSFKSAGYYFSPMAAAEMDGTGTVQILGWGSSGSSSGRKGTIVAMNPDGRVLWKCPAADPLGNRESDQMVAGDLDGDGRKEWVIPGEKEMVVVTAEGLLLSRTGIKDGQPAVLQRVNNKGLLVLVVNDKVTAYGLELNGVEAGNNVEAAAAPAAP